MLQDIAPHIYHNQMSWKEPEADDFVLCYRGRTLYCKVEDGSLVLPRVKDVEPSALQYAFSIDERADYLLSDAELKEANGFSYFDTGKLRTLVPGPALMAAAAGESLYRWYSGQRFCGRCGKPMEKSKIERAMVCPACGNTVYPKICPAVIVAIHDGDRLVLTKYKDRPVKHYALVAGFNEIGESIEETVHREVLEETGLRVRNLRFYKSQPWVFTDTLLFGFFAELDGSDKITVQEDELSEAGWFYRSEIPEDRTHLSLTGEMMELIHGGVPNIVCIQPFACLPNHIVGKGVIKAIRREHPEANIVAIDYDPGASEVNQLNRIKLMLSTAQKNLNRELP